MTTGEFNTWRKSTYSGPNSECVQVAAGRRAVEDFPAWRKSTYSGGNSDCVEVAAGRRAVEDFPAWRKSTHSGGNSECVEVAAGRVAIGVRDTRQLGRGPVLEFPEAAWAAFIAAIGSDDA